MPVMPVPLLPSLPLRLRHFDPEPLPLGFKEYVQVLVAVQRVKVTYVVVLTEIKSVLTKNCTLLENNRHICLLISF